jgi:hypothetical protein
MGRFKRTLAIMHFGSSRSQQLEQTSKELFDKEMAEWRALGKAQNWKMEETKQRKLLLLLDPKLRASLPYELAAADVLSQMANAEMTKKEAHSWACEQAGLDTNAWSKKWQVILVPASGSQER